ncbi:MAG: GIY-YIG nuclease family protein [Singulisphaera sp.]|nr:GIY-YIG nuclease family protein [Singulisphaera sp.]
MKPDAAYDPGKARKRGRGRDPSRARAAGRGVDDVVYIARSRATGLVKIGFSRDPARRLDELALRHGPLDLLLCLAGDRADEKALHRRFAGHAVGHEWFRVSRELESFVGSVLP